MSRLFFVCHSKFCRVQKWKNLFFSRLLSAQRTSCICNTYHMCMYIKDHSINVCAAFICLVYLLLTFHMMDSLDVFSPMNIELIPCESTKTKPKNKISTNHKSMYTVHIIWLRCKPVHFIQLNTSIKSKKFQFCHSHSLNHNSITSSRTIHSLKAWTILRKQLFPIYKQFNAPLKVTSEAHANEQKQEKKESSAETEFKMYCLKHAKW